LRNVRTGFVEALRINSKIEICEPFDKEYIQNGKVYLAPANYHLLVDHGQRFSLSVHDPLNHSRPSIDIIMDSAAEFFREKVIGVVLSGANMDGANGLHKIHNLGGYTIVQNPLNCQISTMPKSCMEVFQPDSIINADEIINFISNL
jgi:two-component system, chemotaxis family, protein-glutamate methylesterase/glutaminase